MVRAKEQVIQRFHEIMWDAYERGAFAGHDHKFTMSQFKKWLKYVSLNIFEFPFEECIFQKDRHIGEYRFFTVKAVAKGLGRAIQFIITDEYDKILDFEEFEIE